MWTTHSCRTHHRPTTDDVITTDTPVLTSSQMFAPLHINKLFFFLSLPLLPFNCQPALVYWRQFMGGSYSNVIKLWAAFHFAMECFIQDSLWMNVVWYTKKNLVPAISENLLTRIFKSDVFMNGNVCMCTHVDLYLQNILYNNKL